MSAAILALALASLLYGAWALVLLRGRAAAEGRLLRLALLGFLALPLGLLAWNAVFAFGPLRAFVGPSPWPALDVPEAAARLRERPAGGPPWTDVVGWTLLATAGLGLLGFLALYLRRRLLQRRTQRVPSRELARAFAEVCARLGLAGRPRLRVAEGTRGVATVGWLRPCVLVSPQLLAELEPRALRQVLFHEIGHLLRRDYLWHLLVTFLRCLQPWNPFVRGLAERLHDAQERAADRFVLERAGVPRAEYAACLARLALRPYRVPLGVGLTRGSRTLARVRALTDGSPPPQPFPRRARASWWLAFAVLFATGAAALPWRSASRAPSPGASNAAWEEPAGTTLTLGAGRHAVPAIVSEGVRVLGVGEASRLDVGHVAGRVAFVGLRVEGAALRIAAGAELDLLDAIVAAPVTVAREARLRARDASFLAGLTVEPGAVVTLAGFTAESAAPWRIAGATFVARDGVFRWDGDAGLVVAERGALTLERVTANAARPERRRKDAPLLDVVDGSGVLHDVRFAQAPTAVRVATASSVRGSSVRFERLGVGLELERGGVFELADVDARDVVFPQRVEGAGELPVARDAPVASWARPAWPGRAAGRAPEADAAVAWLLAHQSRDGRFDSDGLGAPCDDAACGGGGRALHDVGTTALVTSFLLRDPRGLPEVERAVDRALAWLLAQRDATGAFGHPDAEARLWEHAMATTALAWAVRLRPADEGLRSALAAAVAHARRAQGVGGGWHYGRRPEGPPDLLTTAFLVHALAQALPAGFAELRAPLARACALAGDGIRRPPGIGVDPSPDHAAARAYLAALGRARFDASLRVAGPEPDPRGTSWIGRALCAMALAEEERDATRDELASLRRDTVARFETQGHAAGSTTADPEATFALGRVQATALAGWVLEGR